MIRAKIWQPLTLSAFCLHRKAELIDGLIELLLLVVHRIKTNADKKVGKQVLDEMKQRVDNKPRLLRQVAEAALTHPEKTIREGIYPVMDEKKCQAILDEESKGTLQDRIYLKMRSSYRDHIEIMPGLLNMQQFRSSNATHQPVVKAIEVLKRYVGSWGLLSSRRKPTTGRGGSSDVARPRAGEGYAG